MDGAGTLRWLHPRRATTLTVILRADMTLLHTKDFIKASPMFKTVRLLIDLNHDGQSTLIFAGMLEPTSRKKQDSIRCVRVLWRMVCMCKTSSLLTRLVKLVVGNVRI